MHIRFSMYQSLPLSSTQLLQITQENVDEMECLLKKNVFYLENYNRVKDLLGVVDHELSTNSKLNNEHDKILKATLLEKISTIKTQIKNMNKDELTHEPRSSFCNIL